MPLSSSTKVWISFMWQLVNSGRAKLPAQRVVDLLRIRLAARRFHDLADEEAEHLLLAGAELLDLRRVRSDDVGNELVDARGIRDLREAALLDDLVDRAFTAPDGLEDFLRDLARDRAGRDLVEQRGERRRGYARRAYGETLAVQSASHFAHDPVRGDLRRGRRALRDGLEI